MENFILTMENWGTYRQTDGPLQVYNYQERQIETLASFGLDDIPRADALLLFDSHFRAAGYAAEIVMRHEQKYGNKPEFLTCGGHSNKGLPPTTEKLRPSGTNTCSFHGDLTKNGS